jgi:hypothetical protein
MAHKNGYPEMVGSLCGFGGDIRRALPQRHRCQAPVSPFFDTGSLRVTASWKRDTGAWRLFSRDILGTVSHAPAHTWFMKMAGWLSQPNIQDTDERGFPRIQKHDPRGILPARRARRCARRQAPRCSSVSQDSGLSCPLFSKQQYLAQAAQLIYNIRSTAYPCILNATESVQENPRFSYDHGGEARDRLPPGIEASPATDSSRDSRTPRLLASPAGRARIGESGFICDKITHQNPIRP